MPGELEHAVQCRWNQNCTLEDIATTIQDGEFKEKLKERVAEVTKKENYCHNCGSTEHYANNCPKEKEKVYAIEKFPEEESPTEDSESNCMGDAIREQSDKEQHAREEFVVEYQGKTLLEIHRIQLLWGDFRALNNYSKADRKLKDSEARYGATQTECLCLVWDLEKLHYYLEGAVFEAYIDCTALKSLLNMKTTNRDTLRWKIAFQDYEGNMTIIYKEGKSHTNSDGLSRWPLNNVKSNPAYDPEVESKIPIHFMEIDRRKNFRFS
ncbi:hypothetical protein O181_069690 [Austropuccinia psidii MF-1]|uniref:CCHC-type domain-containing protein n=1 Tax=Austropuccinia psidii MF-1 TaxID=1389203 RepID=A0A9Q3I8B7_9BASI|nr:hypothetical protein [Austropuccinia psidii MF-1]